MLSSKTKQPQRAAKTVSAHPAAADRSGDVRGLASWLAIVRTYQKCADTLTERIKPLGIKLAQHEVMMNLLRANALTQQQLAERSFVTKSHMSAVITEMETLGWLSRVDSDIDKRSKVIALTRKGSALAQRAYAVQLEVVTVMMDPLSDKQIDAISTFSNNAFNALTRLETDGTER
jgi:DNA-binding MarR family transcriptional regulator